MKTKKRPPKVLSTSPHPFLQIFSIIFVIKTPTKNKNFSLECYNSLKTLKKQPWSQPLKKGGKQSA
jgi:hypothetical protein